MLTKILIIDKRKELSTKYKKSLESEDISVIISRKLDDAMHQIQEQEPDMIIVSDSIDEELNLFCSKIRALTYTFRPIIIGLSKSADFSDRILVLENGADDFLSEPVNIEEFKIRIKAHLRRDMELNLNPKTHLPNQNYINRTLKRILKTKNNQAVLFISLENIETYKSIYSDVAGDKLIQTLIAIISSTLNSNDFLGQYNDNNFIIITNSYSAEKMATFLTFAFDTVVSKFYSEADAKRGYMMIKSDNLAGMRSNFVSILISGILDIEEINSVEDLISRLIALKKLAKIPSGSNYIFERKSLASENNTVLEHQTNKICINESDSALALLIRTTLELQGYDVIENFEINSDTPKIFVLDSKDDLSGLEICKEIKNSNKFVNSKIIITSTVHDKAKILDAGADLYLPKPYEISDLIKWVEYFMKEEY